MVTLCLHARKLLDLMSRRRPHPSARRSARIRSPGLSLSCLLASYAQHHIPSEGRRAEGLGALMAWGDRLEVRRCSPPDQAATSPGDARPLLALCYRSVCASEMGNGFGARARRWQWQLDGHWFWFGDFRGTS